MSQYPCIYYLLEVVPYNVYSAINIHDVPVNLDSHKDLFATLGPNLTPGTTNFNLTDFKVGAQIKKRNEALLSAKKDKR